MTRALSVRTERQVVARTRGNQVEMSGSAFMASDGNKLLSLPKRQVALAGEAEDSAQYDAVKRDAGVEF